MSAVKSFHKNSRSCVRVGKCESDWLEVNVGLRQGCAMSSWLFNVYMDGVVREMNARVQGNGLALEWKISQLLFMDDTALVAECIKPVVIYG